MSQSSTKENVDKVTLSTVSTVKLAHKVCCNCSLAHGLIVRSEHIQVSVLNRLL